MKIQTETVIPGEEAAYTAFPTFVTCRGEVFLYYRKGVVDKAGSHGKQGRVHCMRFDETDFLNGFGKTRPLCQLGRDHVVFGEGNEMDAIVSKLGPQRYCLATRNYDEEKVMRTFISFSDKPIFKERKALEIQGLDWFAFYGKAFSANGVDVFPAYGSLKGEIFGRPLLLTSHQGRDWKPLASLPSYWDGKTVLNESSLAGVGDGWVLFMRQDTAPFGLWVAYSKDLLQWSKPQKWREAAHAPMALNIRGRLCLCFRNILEKDRAAIALSVFKDVPTFSGGDELVNLDTYVGSVYDGGYGDLGAVGGELFVFYYHGNEEGEPFLKAARLGEEFFD